MQNQFFAMFYHHQVIYRYLLENTPGAAPTPGGPALSLIVRARNPEEAELLLNGFHVVSVGPGIPIIDWANQQTFNCSEAAVYMRRSNTEIGRMVADGTLPNGKAAKINPIFTRKVLDDLIKRQMIYNREPQDSGR